MNHFLGLAPVGLSDNGRLRQALGKIKRTVGEWEDPARWTPPALWHVTLIFFGPRPPEELARIRQTLDDWQPTAQAKLSFHGLGAFPSAEAGRVLWLGVRKTQALLDLQTSLERTYIAAGLLEPPEREFVPHLTLVRFRHARHLHELISLGGRADFGDYEAGELILFESVIQGQIPKHIPRHVKKFQ